MTISPTLNVVCGAGGGAGGLTGTGSGAAGGGGTSSSSNSVVAIFNWLSALFFVLSLLDQVTLAEFGNIFVILPVNPTPTPPLERFTTISPFLKSPEVLVSSSSSSSAAGGGGTFTSSSSNSVVAIFNWLSALFFVLSLLDQVTLAEFGNIFVILPVNPTPTPPLERFTTISPFLKSPEVLFSSSSSSFSSPMPNNLSIVSKVSGS